MELGAIKDTVVYLTEKLGVGVEEVYKIFLNAQTAHIINNVSSFVLLCLFGIIFLYWFKKIKKFSKKNCEDNTPTKKEECYYETCLLFWLILAVVCIFGFLIVQSLIQNTIFRLVAPEYMALQEMIRLIK